MAKRTDHARSSASSNPVRVRFDQFELDEANARLLRDGTAVALAPTPFAVLCALVRQPGSLLTTNALLDEVWGHQFVTDSVLRTAISELRTALDDDARKPRFIETVSRRGYRFIAAPSAIPAAPSVQPHVSGFAAVHAPSLHRSRGTAVTAAPRLGHRVQRQARDCLGRRRAGYRQDDPHRTFRRHAWRRRCRPRPVRRALRCRGTVSSRVGSSIRAVPKRQHPRVVAARCRTHLALAAAVAQHRGRARSAAPRARRGQPGSHAARDRRGSGSLGRAPAAIAGDRGPALE